MRLSLIVSVLDSHEVVRRQLLHFGRILQPDCELILIDDGSECPLQTVCDAVVKPYAFRLHATKDTRPWTQPRGRNIGAALARAPKLLFFDIDHIVTDDVIQHGLTYEGDKMHWQRRPALLDEHGNLVTDREILVQHGMIDDSPSVHGNSFVIRRELFELLGGYDERFCGKYGGDDIDFNRRYAELCKFGMARPEEVRGTAYVYPEPARDKAGWFHGLRERQAAE